MGWHWLGEALMIYIVYDFIFSFSCNYSRDTKRKYIKFRTGIVISFLRIKIKNLFALVVWVPVESVRTGADRPVELRNADCAAAANCNLKIRIMRHSM
jgi:hypothetical protein